MADQCVRTRKIRYQVARELAMSNVTLEQLWMGRDKTYAADLTPAIIANAILTVSLVNGLLKKAALDGVVPGVDEVTHTAVASGWRPPGVNARTKNSAGHSTHMTGEALDLQDTPNRNLARWCLKNVGTLEKCGLWCEDPRWTPDWVHFQTRPPASGKRFFIPSTASPLCAALPEQA